MGNLGETAVIHIRAVFSTISDSTLPSKEEFHDIFIDAFDDYREKWGEDGAGYEALEVSTSDWSGDLETDLFKIVEAERIMARLKWSFPDLSEAQYEQLQRMIIKAKENPVKLGEN